MTPGENPYNEMTDAYLDNMRAGLEKMAADAQALADVKTLDSWALAKIGRQVWVRNYHNGGIGSHAGWSARMVDQDGADYHTTGATPDEARAKAAAWVRGLDDGRHGDPTGAADLMHAAALAGALHVRAVKK